MYLLNKYLNPILWSKTSEAFWRVLSAYVQPQDTILEVGSGTGHVSYMLARRGNSVTLNDIRSDVVIESAKIFITNNVKVGVLPGDYRDIAKKYDLVWNSGLIQCLYGRDRQRFVNKLIEIGRKVLLFYPDTGDPAKVLGSNKNIIPGVDDAKEYPIGDVPELLSRYFDKVSMGILTAQEIDLPFKMYWILGESKL